MLNNLERSLIIRLDLTRGELCLYELCVEILEEKSSYTQKPAFVQKRLLENFANYVSSGIAVDEELSRATWRTVSNQKPSMLSHCRHRRFLFLFSQHSALAINTSSRSKRLTSS